jgi:hypothetical protein
MTNALGSNALHEFPSASACFCSNWTSYFVSPMFMRSRHLIETQSNIERTRTAYFVRGSFARTGLKRYRARSVHKDHGHPSVVSMSPMFMRSRHLIETESNIERSRTAYFVRGSFARAGLKRYRARSVHKVHGHTECGVHEPDVHAVAAFD